MSANAPAVISKKEEPALTREELLKTMQTAEKSLEAARYSNQQIHKKIENSRFVNKSPEAKAVAQQILGAVDEFTQFVEYKFSQEAKIWSGQVPESGLINMQRGIAKQAFSKLSEKSYPAIRLVYGISEDGHYVRGFAPPLDEATVEALDRVFNALLAHKHQVVTEDGFFYKIDETGAKIQKLTVKEIEEIMADLEEDFRKDLEDNNVALHLTAQQREYPGEHRLEEAKKAAAKKAVERIAEIEAAEEEEEEEAEVQPQPQGIGPST